MENGWKMDAATAILKARQVGCIENDDSEPYKSRYEAADLLQELEAEVLQRPPPSCELLVAWCKLERGLQLLETDLLAEGQKLLEEGLAHAWPDTVECMAIQLQAQNALASLWCERSEHTVALQHLQAAADLHSKIVQQQQQQEKEDAAPAAVTPCAAPQDQQQPAQQQQMQPSQEQQEDQQQQEDSSRAAWQAVLHDASSVERDFTTTLFYMAQVYSLMGDKMQSASYCAATLNRQLKQGDFDVNEWIQNCLQLSGCFLDCNAFGLSRHCCSAVEALLLQRLQQQQENKQEQEQQEPRSCDTTPGSTQGTSGSSPGKDQTKERDQAGKPEQQQQQQLKPAASKTPPEQQQHAEGTHACGPSAELLAGLALLEQDVAANVCLAHAKLHLYCLVTSHEVVVEGKQVGFVYNSTTEVPAVLCFDALPDLPALSSLAWGRAALAGGYEEALQLFKPALSWFKRALEHYQLDGWVTEHCNILFEISNLYRCLAGFEPDPHKRCVMHRSRAKLLQPLEGQLSVTHYPGLSRSISLELGNIFREIADIKTAAGREPDKVAAAMQAAAQHYKLFFDSFKDEAGQMPGKVEPEMQQHYLSGMFSLARMLQGLPGTGTLGSTVTEMGATSAGDDKSRREMTSLEQAVALLGSLVKYVQSNEVVDWQEQSAMAEELSSLLQEKLALVRHMSDL